MKTNYVLLIIGTIMLVSCDNSRVSKADNNITYKTVQLPYVVDIEKNLNNVKSILLSSIGKDLEYIPLETKSNSLLTNIRDIQFSDSSIYICDFDKLLQFNYTGKFIRQIGSNGRGPGEYIHIMGFCIDETHRKIYIIAWGIDKILEFDYEGHFCSSFKRPCSSEQFFVMDSNRFIFHLYNSTPGQPDYSIYSLYITDLEFNPIMKILNYNTRKKENGFAIGSSPFYTFQKNVRFMEFCVDTLCSFSNDKLEPFATFNLGKMKMNPDFSISNNDTAYIKKQLNQKIWISELLEDDQYLYIDINYGLKSSRPSIFNKKTMETTFLINNGFINDLDGGLTFWPRIVVNDSILIDCLKANDLINHILNANLTDLRKRYGERFPKLENLVSNLDEMSNPVLRILKPI